MDTQTCARKVLAFLHPYYQSKCGYVFGGSYSVSLDEKGGKLLIFWNGWFRSPEEKDDSFGHPKFMCLEIPLVERDIAPPASLNAGSDPKLWRPFNSPNHGGQGQGVLFADSHAEFMTTPTVGVGKDNIYTAWKRQGDSGDPNTRMHGDRPGNAAPFNSLTPGGNTDSLIYP